MAELKPVLFLLWRGGLRKFLTAPLGAPGSVLMLLLMGLAVMGWSSFQKPLDEAVFRLALGETSHIQPILNALFVVWCLAPAVLRGGGSDIDSAVRMRRFPITTKQSLIIISSDLAISPLTWLLLAISLSIWPALAGAPTGMWALCGYGIFLATCMCCCMACAFGLLLFELSPRSRPFLIVGIALITYLQYRLHLFDQLAVGGIVIMLAGPEPLPGLKMVLLMFLTTFLLGMKLFQTLHHDLWRDPGDDARLPGFSVFDKLPDWPGRWGIFIQKVVGHCYRGFEPYFGWILCLGFLAYLIQTPDPEILAFLVATNLILAVQAGMFFNMFGHYQNGIFRLLMLPISGSRLLGLVNLGLVLAAVAPAIPVFVAALWVWGPACGLTGLISFCGTLAAQLAWGNHISLVNPIRRGGMALPGSSRGKVAGLAAALAPATIFALLTMNTGSGESLLPALILMMVSWGAYAVSLSRAGTNLKNAQSVLLERLTIN